MPPNRTSEGRTHQSDGKSSFYKLLHYMKKGVNTNSTASALAQEALVPGLCITVRSESRRNESVAHRFLGLDVLLPKACSSAGIQG